jgi:hypothetical protein
MVVYEFYVMDEIEEFHLLGTLPERRKDSLRITRESIMKCGKLFFGDSININNLYFIQREV